MKKILDYLNGKKTLIGESVIILLLLFQSKMSPDLFTALISLAGLWTGVGISHKAAKSLKKDK